MQYFTIYEKSPNKVKADKPIHIDQTAEFVKRFMLNNVNSYNVIVKSSRVFKETEPQKLILWNNGDSSVGIQGDHFELDVPFDVDECEWTDIEDFREAMREVYQDYTDNKLFADYTYELKAERMTEMIADADFESLNDIEE